MIALYIWEDPELLKLLKDSLGPQFVEGTAVESGAIDPAPVAIPV